MIQLKMPWCSPTQCLLPPLRSPRLWTRDTGHGCGCLQTLELSESLMSQHQQEGVSPTVSNTQGTLCGIVYQLQVVLGEPCSRLRSGVPGVHVQPHTPTQGITYNQLGYPGLKESQGWAPDLPSHPPPSEGYLLPSSLTSCTCHDDTAWTLAWSLSLSVPTPDTTELVHPCLPSLHPWANIRPTSGRGADGERGWHLSSTTLGSFRFLHFGKTSFSSW